MADVAVILPKPRPDDDEDVVWGLSTATALWSRGERGDAAVWLRRAAEAAASAGQEERAAELGIYATRMDEALQDALDATIPLPPKVAQVAVTPTHPPPIPDETTLPTGSVPLAFEIPAARPSFGSIEVEMDEAPQPRPRSRIPPPLRPLSATPPPLSARVPSVPPPPLPSAPPPPLGVALPPLAPPPPRVPSMTPPPPPAGVRLPSVVPPPRVPSVVPPPSSARPPSAMPPPRPPSAPPVRPPSAPPAPLLGPIRPPPPSGTEAPGSVEALRRKSPARAPILDPWADEPTNPPSSVEPAPRAIHAGGDEVVVNMRQSSPRFPEDDEGVVTSAAPLQATLLRKPAPPKSKPSSRRSTATGENPPGHIAEAGAGVATKSRAPRPRPADRPGANAVPTTATAAIARPALSPSPAPSPATDVDPLDMATLPSGPSPIGRPRPVTVPPPRPMSPPPPPPQDHLDAGALDAVDAFTQLSAEQRLRLTSLARVESLGGDEEVSGFGAALLIEGEAAICATIVDSPACRAVAGTLVPSRGTFGDAVGLRVVAGPSGARVATWDQRFIDDALDDSPAVQQELLARADRLQALAGATMGPLGELDEAVRNQLLDRLSVHVVTPREAVIEAGVQPLGLVIVGVGVLDLVDPDAAAAGSVRQGEVLFPREVLDVAPAPRGARGGVAGAILLVGEQRVAAEVAGDVPAIAAMLGGG